MYTDKTKQREANKAHAKAYRLRKGMTQGMTQGMTVIPKERVIPEVIEDGRKVVDEFVAKLIIQQAVKAYRLRKKGVTPDALPPVIPVTPVMKTKGDAEVVVRSLPRSIGMGGDSKSEMMKRFLGGK